MQGFSGLRDRFLLYLLCLLQYYPLKEVLAAEYLLEDFRPDLIEMVLDKLRPELVRLVQSAITRCPEDVLVCCLSCNLGCMKGSTQYLISPYCPTPNF